MRTLNDKKGRVLLGLLLFLLAYVPAIGATDNDSATKQDKFRIGYLEGGPYWIFTEALNATKTSLGNLGWGDKVEFPEEIRFSPGWEAEKKEELQQRAKELMARDDIDLIIVAGTDATEAILKANNGRTPILAMAVSDPVKSNFVLDEKDSGVDNFTVRIVPDQFKRMFMIFHDVVGFKKLGLIYPDTESGRKYTNLEDARKVAEERGFEIKEYTKIGRSERTEECLEGIEWLVKQGIDAFFIPSLNCFDWNKGDVKKLLDILMENKIPSFARNGTQFVKAGALMGFSTIDFTSRGDFLADKVVKILEGAKPRSLPMVDRAMPKLSFNLYVAERIGFDPPFDILATSDEVFNNITLPDGAGSN